MLETNLTYIKDLSLTWANQLIIQQQYPCKINGVEPKYFYVKKKDRLSLPNDYATLLYYTITLSLAEDSALISYSKQRYNSLPSALYREGIREEYLDDGHQMVTKLTRVDLSQVVFPVALNAWLTDEVTPNPLNLSYGLVKQYPEYVLAMALFWFNYNREDVSRNISQERMKIIYEYAHERTNLILNSRQQRHEQ